MSIGKKMSDRQKIKGVLTLIYEMIIAVSEEKTDAPKLKKAFDKVAEIYDESAKEEYFEWKRLWYRIVESPEYRRIICSEDIAECSKNEKKKNI